MAVAERAPALKPAEPVATSRPIPPDAQPGVPPSAPSSLPAVDLPLAEDPTFYPSTKLDVHPQALRRIQPAYPSAAADAGVQGEVTLLLLIDEYGVVKEASVADAKPEGWFEDATLDALKNVRFRPAERNGRVVKSRVLVRVTYELNGNSSATRRVPVR